MRKSSWVCFGLAVLALQFAATVPAGNGFWTSTGPWGGRVFGLQIDPSTPGRLYVSSAGGFFRSLDGGTTWTRTGSGLIGLGEGTALHMDRDRPLRLYVVDFSGRLMRSVDGGQNWSPAGFDTRAAGVFPTRYADVPGAARNGEFYFAVRSNFATSGVYKTTDDGATFVRLAGLPASRGISSIAVSPTNPDLVIAGGDFTPGTVAGAAVPQIWRSTDAGATWTVVREEPAPNPGAFSIAQAVTAISFGPGSTVYAASASGLLHSADNGATWNLRLAGVNPVAVAAHPTLADTVYVGVPQGALVVTAADTAAPVSSALSTLLSPNPSFTDFNTPPRPIQGSVAQLVLTPDFPTAGSGLWAVTEHAGLFRSGDGGVTWNDAFNTGLSAMNIRAVAVHPNPAAPPGPRPPDTRIYAGWGDPFTPSQALWRSIDNGNNWPVANSGLRAVQVRSVVIDPTTTGSILSTVVYAAGRGTQTGGSGFVSGPAPGNNTASRNGGLYKSVNGGNTWTTIDATLPTVTSGTRTFADIGLVRTLILDPRSCSVGPPPGPTGTPCTAASGPLRTVYAAADGLQSPPVTGLFSHRIVRSTDGGATWAARDSGIPNFVASGTGRQWVTPIPLVMDPTNSDVLYVGTALRYFDSAVPRPPPTLQNGVFKSTDGGATWTFSSAGLPFRDGSTTTRHDVLAIGISARNPQVLWAATSTVTGTTGNATSLYRSTDGGATWAEARAGIPAGLDIRAIVVNTPADTTIPEAIYVSGGGNVANPGAVYRSTDNGTTWVSISIGLPADSALAIAIDPRDRRRVVAGTNAGVWELTQQPDVDLDGAPDFVENNAPNGGDGNGDSQPDALQGDVGSTIVLDNRPARRPDGFVGCQGSFTTEIINDTECPQARDVQARFIDEFPLDPVPGGNGRNFRYPFDAIRFEVPQCQRAVVEITFHLAGSSPTVCPTFDDEQWSFRFYGPQVPGDGATVGWYDLGNRAVRAGPRKWRLTLDAGQFGSYRPLDANTVANNSLLFVGAPALSGDRILRSGFEPGEN